MVPDVAVEPTRGCPHRGLRTLSGGPALAHLAASQLYGVGPYLVEIAVAPAQTVSISQVQELSENPAIKVC